MLESNTINGEWGLLDEKGASVVSFTSFIDISVRNEGQALSYPVEEGSFTNYNKVESPLDISVTLATQGSESDFEFILVKLDEYKREAVTLSVITPALLYRNMTLKSYSYERKQENNAGMLSVQLDLVEVRKSGQEGSALVSRFKNPSSASPIHTGHASARPLDDKIVQLLTKSN